MNHPDAVRFARRSLKKVRFLLAELFWEEYQGMLVVRKKKYTIEDVQAALGPPPKGPKTLKQLREAKLRYLAKKAARARGR
jgi:hypothetical protein